MRLRTVLVGFLGFALGSLLATSIAIAGPNCVTGVNPCEGTSGRDVMDGTSA